MLPRPCYFMSAVFFSAAILTIFVVSFFIFVFVSCLLELFPSPGGSAIEGLQDTGVATQRGPSRESRNTTGTGSGLASGDAILVDMTRLADVLGMCTCVCVTSDVL